MSYDGPLGEPAGPAGQPGQAGSTFNRTAGGLPPVLDLAFDSGTLHALRSEVRVRARQAGLSEDRTADVVVAVHELAANAISHGGGKGRLRVWDLAGALHCQVDDGDPDASGDAAAALNSLPDLPGHGLWVARQVADEMRTMSGPRGTRAMLTFDLPTTD